MPRESFFARHQALRPLAIRDYRLLLLGSTLVGIVMPMHFLTQVFWVQEHYPDRDIFYTTLIAGSRGAAMLLFALIGGALADRMERRFVLLVCESASLAINAVIAVLMLTNLAGDATIFLVVGCTFAAAGVMSIDQPARSASIPTIVGMETLASAMSLNMLAMQLTLPMTLPLVGILNGAFEPGQVYAGSLVLFAVIIPAIAALRFRSKGGAAAGQGMLGNIRDGIRYTAANRVIFAVMAMVVVIQVVAMPGVANPLGPVWMTKVLGLSETQFGFMAMTWGIGAGMASAFFARKNFLARRGATLCVVTVVFGLNVLVFGYSRNVPLTAVANFVLGFAFTGVMLTSTTIIQHLVADEMRGRVMGLFPLTLGLAQLNTMPVGALAEWRGLPFMVPTLGWLTLALIGAVVLRMPAIRKVDPAPLKAAAPLPEPAAG